MSANDKTGNMRERIFLSFYRKKRGSITVEAAISSTLFFFAMLTILQFGRIQIASSELLAGMQETAKQMAVYACIKDLGLSEEGSLAGDLLVSGISASYAQNTVLAASPIANASGKFSVLQSRFFFHEIVDMTGTFQLTNTLSVIPVKRVKAILRARVRAWTGREGSKKVKEAEDGDGEDGEDEEEEQEHETVYMTATGTVYHKDPNCTHIKLSVRKVSASAVETLRNSNGGKYHACEKCGGGNGGSVYITSQGDRYHSSLTCSGIKRTVTEYDLADLEGVRACSKCGGYE